MIVHAGNTEKITVFVGNTVSVRLKKALHKSDTARVRLKGCAHGQYGDCKIAHGQGTTKGLYTPPTKARLKRCTHKREINVYKRGLRISKLQQ